MFFSGVYVVGAAFDVDELVGEDRAALRLGEAAA